MTSMRAKKLKQAGCIGLGVLIFSGGVKADPALPPPVGQKVYAAPTPSANPPSDLDSSFDNLDVIDPSLKGQLAVLRVGSEVGENKLLSIFAGLKNKTVHQLNLEMETIYKDKDDNPLNAGSWIPFTLGPREEKEYHSTAITVDAVDFLVRGRRVPAAVSTHG